MNELMEVSLRIAKADAGLSIFSALRRKEWWQQVPESVNRQLDAEIAELVDDREGCVIERDRLLMLRSMRKVVAHAELDTDSTSNNVILLFDKQA